MMGIKSPSAEAAKAGKHIMEMTEAFFKGYEIGTAKHANCLSVLVAYTPKYWEFKRTPFKSLQEYQITRWLSQVSNGGVVGNKAVLICYNERHPEQSYMIVEDLPI